MEAKIRTMRTTDLVRDDIQRALAALKRLDEAEAAGDAGRAAFAARQARAALEVALMYCQPRQAQADAAIAAAVLAKANAPKGGAR
jgi:hypothetical protein